MFLSRSGWRMLIVARAAVWAATGSIAGPLMVVLIPALLPAISSSHSSLDFVGTFLGGYVLGVATLAVIALVLGFPVYFLLLLLWPIAASRFPRLELIRWQFLSIMVVFAVPAGLVGYLVSRNDAGAAIGASPDALTFAAICFITAWTGLVIPRLVLGFLRPGAFLYPGDQRLQTMSAD